MMSLDQIRKTLCEGARTPLSSQVRRRVAGRPLCAENLRNAVNDIETSFGLDIIAIGAGAFIYGDLRRSYHPEFHIETRASEIQKNLVGYLWGIPILLGCGNLSHSEIVFVAENGQSWNLDVANPVRVSVHEEDQAKTLRRYGYHPAKGSPGYWVNKNIGSFLTFEGACGVVRAWQEIERHTGSPVSSWMTKGDKCARCGGTGNIGFTMTVRCPEC